MVTNSATASYANLDVRVAGRGYNINKKMGNQIICDLDTHLSCYLFPLPFVEAAFLTGLLISVGV